MNSFFYAEEVGNDNYLKFNKQQEETIFPEIRGSDTGRFSQKSERLCQSILTNQQDFFKPTTLSKRRKKKTVFYKVTDPPPYSETLFTISNTT
jgi:hypothetical protein